MGECGDSADSTELGKTASARFRECCRQVQEEVVRSSRNKIHQAWPKPFSRALQREAKSGSEKFPPLLLLLSRCLQSPHLPLDRTRDCHGTFRQTCGRGHRFSRLVPRALSLSGNFQQLRTPKWSRSLLADSIFKYFHLSFQGRGLLQMRRLPPEGRQRPPVQRE